MLLLGNWNRETKIKVVGGLTLILFLMEIIVGYTADSIALIADSFHMLSDLLALCIAHYAIKLAQQRTKKANLSFGYQRAEILGAFANSIFLIALSFTIIIEAIQRFVTPVDIENPKIVLIVGCVGLTSNILGMVLFGGHVGHNHDHGEGGEKTKSHNHALEDSPVLEDNTGVESVPMHYSSKSRVNVLAAADRIRGSSSATWSHSIEIKEVKEVKKVEGHNHDHQESHKGHSHDNSNMNMQGLFLHALGDALGSVGVIISSLIIMFADGSWRFYMDPVISLLISGLIISSCIPLVRNASFILLQGTPSHISMDTLKTEILKLSGVLGIHEFHVWGLSDNKNVASVHVRVQETNARSYMEIATTIKKLLHGYGIHSTTVQPEFAQPSTVISNSALGLETKETGCLLKCEASDCNEQICCPEDEPRFLVSEGTVAQTTRSASPGNVAFKMGVRNSHYLRNEHDHHEHSHGHAGKCTTTSIV
ncbi:UNVERIFIED_CONTAM: hypothetical protein HDU68_002615 [Siphonaria sp. JEL0065]|nr:hypothetical protein HDU68_002615 [Siphonaria sp. JEL0065]